MNSGQLAAIHVCVNQMVKFENGAFTFAVL